MNSAAHQTFMVFSNQNKAEVTKWSEKLRRLLWTGTFESLNEARNLIFSSIGGRVDQVLSYTCPTFTRYINEVYIALMELDQGRPEKVLSLIDKNVINAVMNTAQSEIAFYTAREEALRANAQRKAASAQANAARRHAEQGEANARRTNNARARQAAENARMAANAARRATREREQEARALAAEQARLNATMRKAKEAANELKKKARTEANAARQQAGPRRRQSPPRQTNANRKRTLRNEQNRAFKEQVNRVSHWRRTFENAKSRSGLTTRQTIRRMAKNHLGLNLNSVLLNTGNVSKKVRFLLHPNKGKSSNNKALRQVLSAEL
jgi:hypothetical protein